MRRINGQTVFLRSLTADDSKALLALRLRNRDFFAPYEPLTTEADFTLKAVRDSLEHAMREEEEDRAYSFGIFACDDEALAGRIRLTNVFRGPWQNANIGYYVDQDRNSKGYGTEAVRLVTSFAFAEAKLHRVQAGVMTDNVRSIRVLEKAAFRREGLALRYLNIGGAWRDHFIYATTVEEWSD